MVERGELPGFQKPLTPEKTKAVRMAVVKREGQSVYCSCGWTTRHGRDKVLEDRTDRHLDRKHDGQGLRL